MKYLNTEIKVVKIMAYTYKDSFIFCVDFCTFP